MPACRFIAAANELPLEQVAGGALRLRTKLLHKYLAPIEAEVRLKGEGWGEGAQRTLVDMCAFGSKAARAV